MGLEPELPTNDEMMALLSLWVDHYSGQGLDRPECRQRAIDDTLHRLAKRHPRLTGDAVAACFDMALVEEYIVDEDGYRSQGFPVNSKETKEALRPVPERLSKFTTTLVPAWRDSRVVTDGMGSAVLVRLRIDNVVRFGFLTAGHVWAGFQEMGAPGVGLYVEREAGEPSLEDGVSFEVTSERRGFYLDEFDIFGWYNREEVDWGPDIALLLIRSPVRITKLRTEYRKEFLPLDGTDLPPGLRRRMAWGIFGSQDTEGLDEPVTFRSEFIGGEVRGRPVERDGFDYVDLKLPFEDGQAVTYGGYSGGGLWHVPVFFSKTEQNFRSYPQYAALSGVAISESADMRRADASVRCHCVESIARVVARAKRGKRGPLLGAHDKE